MAKNTLKKTLKKGVCRSGCKGRILRSGRYCRCIEHKLPNLGTHKSINPIYSPDIARYSESDTIKRYENRFSYQSFKTKLKKFGLSEHELDLVLARFGEDKTFDEIVKEQGWVSISSAAYHFKQILKKLRERNYK